MGRCTHQYHDNPERRCPRQSPPGAALCIWHQTATRKSDPYVALVLGRLLDELDDCDGFHLAGLRWPRASLAGRSLIACDLRDALLNEADLRGAKLQAAVLRRAVLIDADLRDADLTGADLTMINLQGADLRGACLRDCLLADANLRDADLRDADLTDARLDSFAWNRRTRFSGITGFDPTGESCLPGEDDETQVFAAPLALGIHRDGDGPVDAWDPEWDRTHVYRSAIGERGALEHEREQAATPAATPDRLEQPAQATRKRAVVRFHPGMAYYGILAASLLLVMIACGTAVVLLTRLQTERRDNAALAAQIQEARTGSDPTTDPSAEAEVAAQRERHNERLQAEIGQLREQRRQMESRIEELVNDNAEQRLTLARLQSREHLVQELRDQHQQLLADHRALRRENQRLHDTARILNAGIDSLQQQRDELAAFRQQHLTTQVTHTRLQETTDRLLTENRSLTSSNDNLRLVNESLRERLQEAEGSLNAFLAHIEGSRLKDFLQTGEDETPTIPITPGTPVVFGGEYIVTARLDAGERPGTIRTRITLQRPPHRQMPDVTLLLYGRDGRPLRSLSASFPTPDPDSSFATIDTTISTQDMPRSIRVLVNPALDARLLAARDR